MYNRYIPSSDGTFRREIVPDPPPPSPPPEPVPVVIEPIVVPPEKPDRRPEKQDVPKEKSVQITKPANEHGKDHAPGSPGTIRNLIPSSIDTGDLLVLLILLLLLVDGEEDDYLSVILTIAAFILL